MPLKIELILVPQGAEYRAVCGGLRQTLNPPTVFPIPVGAIAVAAYLEQLHQTGVLNSGQQVLMMGLCGGLKSDLAVGQGVLYDTCLTTNSDQVGIHLDCDRALPTTLQHTLPGMVRRVTAVMSDRVIWRAADKQQLAQDTGADVVDMESFAAVQRLTDWGLTVATLRVVSDDCQHDIPNLAAAIDAQGALMPEAIAIAMIKQPIAALRLIRNSMHSLKLLQSLTAELFKDVPN